MSAQVRLYAISVVAALVLSCGLRVPQLSLDALSQGVSPAEMERLAKLGEEMDQKCGELEHQEITFDEEYALGGAVAVNWADRGGGLYHDEVSSPLKAAERRLPKNALNAYVARVGKNLAAQSPRPGLRWTFGVLDSPVVNAFSAPGGYVMVTRGLLEKLENEAQLAGVLAHEIAHINLKHAAKVYQSFLATECKKDVARARVGGFLDKQASSLFSTEVRLSNNPIFGKFTDMVVGFLLDNGFEREQEFAADWQAADLMTRAGYNPFEFIAFLDKIPEGPQHFSKHPPRRDRQQKLRNVVASLAEDDLIKLEGRKLEDYPKVALGPEVAAALPGAERAAR